MIVQITLINLISLILYTIGVLMIGSSIGLLIAALMCAAKRGDEIGRQSGSNETIL